MNIAPTWGWVINRAIDVLSDPKSSKTDREFFAGELRRLAAAIDAKKKEVEE